MVFAVLLKYFANKVDRKVRMGHILSILNFELMT